MWVCLQCMHTIVCVHTSFPTVGACVPIIECVFTYMHVHMMVYIIHVPVCVYVCTACSHVWGVWVMPIKLGSCTGGLIHVNPSIRDDGW